MRVKPELWFSGAFRCFGCGGEIAVETYAAIVDTVGLEVHCRHCRQGYTVTRSGAIPITKGQATEGQ